MERARRELSIDMAVGVTILKNIKKKKKIICSVLPLPQNGYIIPAPGITFIIGYFNLTYYAYMYVVQLRRIVSNEVFLKTSENTRGVNS